MSYAAHVFKSYFGYSVTPRRTSSMMQVHKERQCGRWRVSRGDGSATWLTRTSMPVANCSGRTR